MKTIIAVIVLVGLVGGLWFFAGRTKTTTPENLTSQNNTTSLSTFNNSETSQDKTVTNEQTVSKTKTMDITSETKQYTEAVLVTNVGDITLKLDLDNTPKTAENFIKLAEKGFYNGTRFHRVIAGFMIQGGDPLSANIAKKDFWGTGGPGYQFADEIKTTNNNKNGTISMANAGPNTNGSQFFINVTNNDFLNPKHTVFGYVTDGMDVVQKIAITKVDDADRPIADVIINKIILK